MTNVLFVDDDADIREGVVLLLEDAGFCVATAGDGREALELLRSGAPPPALIVMDLMMPEMNGWELREHLLRDAALAAIPIVVVTGDTRAEHRAEQLGAAGYLAKPFDGAALLEMVSRLGNPVR